MLTAIGAGRGLPGDDDVADGVRFELTEGRPSPVFKTGALNHSTTHPRQEVGGGSTARASGSRPEGCHRRGSGGNDEKVLGATAHKRPNGNAAVEGGQPSPLRFGEAEQVDVRELPVRDRQR